MFIKLKYNNMRKRKLTKGNVRINGLVTNYSDLIILKNFCPSEPDSRSM